MVEETGSSTIIFEGPPLMGKTTQIDLLEDYLSDRGYEVEVLGRATEECPTREKINRLREKSDGFTRDLDEITVEEETELWAQYYEEKSDLINRKSKDENLDYVLVDRFMLSLIPVQEPASDQSLCELVDMYGDKVEQVSSDVVVLLSTDEDVFPERYLERKGAEIPEDFYDEVKRIRGNYEELRNCFELEYVDAGQDIQQVHHDVLRSMEDRSIL